MSDQPTLVQVGERFELKAHFTRDEIRSLARALGDMNPVHHDLEAAIRMGFPDLIAAGAHSVGPFTSMVATHFSTDTPTRRTDTLGLEFSFRFQAPVVAGDAITMRWKVVRVEPKPKLGGELVFLEGEMVNQRGIPVISSEGTILVKPRA